MNLGTSCYIFSKISKKQKSQSVHIIHCDFLDLDKNDKNNFVYSSLKAFKLQKEYKGIQVYFSIIMIILYCMASEDLKWI